MIKRTLYSIFSLFTATAGAEKEGSNCAHNSYKNIYCHIVCLGHQRSKILKANRNQQLAIGNWQLAIGYWLLAIGYWLLAIELFEVKKKKKF